MSGKNPYISGNAASGVDKSEGQGRRVVVAMSGGVDSSVAAALLKEQGYDVIGIALQVTDYSKYREDQSGGNCCSIKDMEDARRVCTKIGIPFYVLDTEKSFDSNVVNYFINEYISGHTPNPCVMCNTSVKFNHLYKKAMDMGAEFVATGHFAKVSRESDLGYCLWRGDDSKKDQTYFLFNLTQSQLQRTLFPVGHLTKDKVRALARKWELPVSEKAESQEICFVPGNDYSTFIRSKVSPYYRPRGYFVDTDGHVLGDHEGVYRYTIGQRKGLQSALENGQRLGYQMPEPLYVVRLDPARAHVVVGGEDDLCHYGLIASKVNWICAPELQHMSQPMQAKIRYGAEAKSCTVEQYGGSRVVVRFAEKQRAITPGQAIAFYKNNLCLGGGWIDRPIQLKKDEIPNIGKTAIKVLSVS